MIYEIDGDTHGEEEVTNVVRDINRQSHIREMEPVAQPD